MGNNNGHSHPKVITTAQPEPPYTGPQAQYQFVNVEVRMAVYGAFNFLSNQMLTSNVDTYYPLLAQQYEQGFRLLTFYHIPMQARREGAFSMGVLMPFQGIFCKYPDTAQRGRFQLRIEKSVIQPRIIWNGLITYGNETVTDTTHLNQTIANMAQSGARLICIELTGQEEVKASFSFTPKLPVYGVDLFFEVPLDAESETYVYNVVSVPVITKYGFASDPRVFCDWIGIFSQHLNRGFKLIEIFVDASKIKEVFKNEVRSNCLWFFEKPNSKINDETPVYQGTIVEHYIKVTPSGFSDTRVSTKWEPVMQDMGNKGWELACIVETPEVHNTGLMTLEMKMLLFFQKRILS
ncbi:unnamed protein product [Lymnaea stagnalis]|uniref:DUF4177 domain-containing protein n=1 Tax=Lymnaea stagnalis TaxID=6523 RepID=A0AAV2IBR3_LYMST